jgi:hypothetical protein
MLVLKGRIEKSTLQCQGTSVLPLYISPPLKVTQKMAELCKCHCHICIVAVFEEIVTHNDDMWLLLVGHA